MAVVNSGTGVLVDSGGVTLAGFTNAAATNIKVQDGTVYTITSNSVGSNANGQISLAKSSGAVATLDSNHTFVCTNASVQSGLGTDPPVSNMALSIKGAKLVFTGGASSSEIIAPVIGNTETQVIYRAGGSTWNSAHPGVNIDGSTFIFQAGGDGHLGRHPNATVKNPKLIWTSTSPSVFVLGANQAWGADNKPSAMDGFTFQSITGNNLVSIFTWTNNAIPGQFANNYFFVCRDWTYNVATVGTQPNAIRRSYRRTDATALASSYWGAVLVCPTYLHIDLKTTLSASGVPGSPATYLRTVSYAEAGVSAGDKCVDVLSLRFAPTVVDPVGNRLANTSIVVLNTNANCSASNTIGNFRARLAASGSTDSTGRFVITESTTKDYTSNSSHRTDSIVIRNRTLTTAWHKWWESGCKLIPIADSRNGTGNTAPESYAANEFVVSYRRPGSQFFSGALDMSAPQSPTVALSADANYNTAASTTGITISYSAGVTTAALAGGNHTLDGIWKAVIDFHAHPDRNEAESVLPFTEWTAGEMHFGAALRITGNPAAIIGSGSQVKAIVSSVAESFGTAGHPTVTAALEDANGVRVTVRKSGGGNFNIAARYGTTGSYTDLGFQSDVSTVTYTVPKGQPVEVIMWSLGYVTYGRTISTVDGGVVFDAEMVLNPNINTALDVSSYISNITVTNGGGLFNVTFNAPMIVSGIELGKAVIHRLVGQEVALKAGFPPGSTATIEILADEIKNNLPAVQLIVGAGLSVTDRVYLDFFINTAPALTINPSYVINPVRADGNQVQILRAKPALDSSQLAAAVRDELQTELSRMDVAVSTRLATTAYTAPANADIAAIKAKTDTLVNAPTLSQIEASTVLAKEATVSTRASQSSVNAIPTNPLLANDTRLNNLDATISSRSTLTAPQVRTELSTELGRIDVAVSSRLATSGYTAPANADIVAIKAKTDTLVNAPTVADIEASTVLAKEATVASKASQSSVNALGIPLQASAYVAPDNTKIAEIKTKVDTLQNTDLTAVNSGIADIKGTGFDATKHNLVAIKRQASLAAALSA